MKEKLSNYLLVAVLQAMLAVCRGISLKEKLSNHLLVAVLQSMLAICRGIKMIYDMFFTVKTDRKYKV